jgi:hypothetical protein
MNLKDQSGQTSYRVSSMARHDWIMTFTDRYVIIIKLLRRVTDFLEIRPCSPLKVNWRFWGTYRLHLQGLRINRRRYQRESRWRGFAFTLWYLACLISRPWRWSRYVPPKRRLTFNGLHGVSLDSHRFENLKSYGKLLDSVINIKWEPESPYRRLFFRKVGCLWCDVTWEMF